MMVMLAAFAAFAKPVRVIFDTDMYTDYDDAGALACLHTLADAGECEILATVACTRDAMSVAMCEIINASRGRPGIPVGCTKGMGQSGMDPIHVRIYGETVRRYAKWVKTPNSNDAPDATDVYRRVLAAQPDGSVVICSVGFLTNLRKLLESAPDGHSPLDGRALVARKVKGWVAMACRYPNGREYNSGTDAESSRIALAEWPTPVEIVDFEYGRDCFAGRALAESGAKDDPVAEIFARQLPSREEIRANPAQRLQWCDGLAGHAAWDQVTVLAAVRGAKRYFNVQRGTYRMVGEKGDDEWVRDEANGRHLRLTERLPKDEVAELVDRLMCRVRADDGAAEVGSGELTWGGRPAHIAVVNPVVPAGDVISLRGEWQFTTAAREGLKVRPNRNGIWPKLALESWKNPIMIDVPACWESQGVGEPGPSVPWDVSWDENSKPIRAKYMGSGWYCKDVAIPSSWQERRIWLKIGGVKSTAWIWVNGKQVAQVRNYCGTEKFDVTDVVAPGEKARVVLEVDNRIGSRKGLMSALHRWGGIYRDIELESTPQTYVDDAWVRGDFDRRIAEVHVRVSGSRNRQGIRIRCAIDDEAKEVECPAFEDGSAKDVVVTVPLGNFRPWSPDAPNLYTARIDLVSGEMPVQTRFERFGVRKFEVCGKEFRLNGRPFFVRGFGDDHVYPITGMSPADRNIHRKHLAMARSAGFNYVRLHTHCELPEYFEAADELGIMVQPELPYYSDVTEEDFEFDPRRDVTELWRNFRRHPSFATYSMGNEGEFGYPLDPALHRYVKRLDPDRLKINQDCNHDWVNSADRADFVGGPIAEWARGSFNPDRPFVAHEYLNLCVKLDYRLEPRFSGVWLPPESIEKRMKFIRAAGLDETWSERLQDAQHALQKAHVKHGLEAARADPFCDGYIFWTIADVVVWNARANCYSAQGLLNPFWEEKRGGAALEDVVTFNGPSCTLVDLDPGKSVFVTGERIKAVVRFAHFGEEPLVGTTCEWCLGIGGTGLASGTCPVGDVALGGVRQVAEFKLTVPPVPRPVKACLRVSVGGVANSWELWLFPKGPARDEILSRAAISGVVVSRKGAPEADRALREGKGVITVDGTDGKPNVSLGWWWMGNQVGAAVRHHPASGDFPHEGVLSPLFNRLVKDGGLPLPAPEVRPEEMIFVGEGGSGCFLYLAERTVGRSRLLECHGLDILSDLPEANALLSAFVDHAGKPVDKLR